MNTSKRTQTPKTHTSASRAAKIFADASARACASLCGVSVQAMRRRREPARNGNKEEEQAAAEKVRIIGAKQMHDVYKTKLCFVRPIQSTKNNMMNEITRRKKAFV